MIMMESNTKKEEKCCFYFTDVHHHYLKDAMENKKSIIRILPFPLQRKILEYHPNLPKMPTLFWKHLRTHYDRRMCRHCGRCLPMGRKRYYCLCQRWGGKKGPRRYQAFTFEDELSNRYRCWKTRLIPGLIFSRPSEYFLDYIKKTHDYVSRDLEEDGLSASVYPLDWYYVTSCQPHLLISFSNFCALPWHRYEKSVSLMNTVSDLLDQFHHRSSQISEYHPHWLFEKIINTNTHLRTLSDTFSIPGSDQNGHPFFSYPSVESMGFSSKNSVRTMNKGVMSLTYFINNEWPLLALRRFEFGTNYKKGAHYLFHASDRRRYRKTKYSLSHLYGPVNNLYQW